MKEQILRFIKRLEEKHNVRIVMAIESGSRAWGFASEDSDFDVRCVHIGKIEDYLGLNEVPKQINELSGNLDIESWDIKKFAELSLKSNPQIEEWIRSPIVYIDLNFLEKFRKIFDNGCSKEYMRIHYLNMAKQNYHKYMSIGLAHSCKKYLYVLRAIACAKYIEKYNKLPPLPYADVIDCLPDYAGKFFGKCVIKKNMTENTKITSNSDVIKFIEKNISDTPKPKPSEEIFSKKDELNEFLIKTIKMFRNK